MIGSQQLLLPISSRFDAPPTKERSTMKVQGENLEMLLRTRFNPLIESWASYRCVQLVERVQQSLIRMDQ